MPVGLMAPVEHGCSAGVFCWGKDMAFTSILWDRNIPAGLPEAQPEFFSDLNLDYVVEAIVSAQKLRYLKPSFWTPLRDVGLIRYRQEVARDLEDQGLLKAIKRFSTAMAEMRRFLALAEQVDFKYFREGWILEGALLYCSAVEGLLKSLAEAEPRSRGLKEFREYLHDYTRSPRFLSLCSDARKTKAGLENVRYCVLIESGRFKVKMFEDEADYSGEVEDIFAKFKQTGSNVTRVQPVAPSSGGMSHVEAKILEFVAKLYPRPFAALDDFCSRHVPFSDERVVSFEREIQFYVAYLDFISALKSRGLPFCIPEVSATEKKEHVRDSFDIALAYRLSRAEKEVVLNGYQLLDPERVIVVTGPNQGGKTTFARMFGQLHYLASLGLPVPGREGCLFVPKQIFTHFERREDINTLRGKLEDDLVRIKDAMERATSDSLFVLNEIFSSTSLQDAIFLSREVMARLQGLDALAIWVTFLDELSSFNEKTVSMVATVDPRDPTVRTFRIVRRPAEGLAYALSLAHKWGVTYERIRERIP